MLGFMAGLDKLPGWMTFLGSFLALTGIYLIE